MCLSSERSATNHFNRLFFFFQLPAPAQLAHAQMGILVFPGVKGSVAHPELPAEITDRVPVSACRIAETMSSSENFDRFIGPLLSSRTTEAGIVLQFQSVVVFRGNVTGFGSVARRHRSLGFAKEKCFYSTRLSQERVCLLNVHVLW